MLLLLIRIRCVAVRVGILIGLAVAVGVWHVVHRVRRLRLQLVTAIVVSRPVGDLERLVVVGIGPVVELVRRALVAVGGVATMGIHEGIVAAVVRIVVMTALVGAAAYLRGHMISSGHLYMECWLAGRVADSRALGSGRWQRFQGRQRLSLWARPWGRLGRSTCSNLPRSTRPPPCAFAVVTMLSDLANAYLWGCKPCRLCDVVVRSFRFRFRCAAGRRSGREGL